MLTVAIADAGQVGRRRLEDYQRLSATQVLRINPEVVPESALDGDLTGVDYRDLFRGLSARAVDCCGSVTERAKMALGAALAGKHVLVEQPFALSLGEADEVIAACRDAGVTLTVLQPLRSQPLSRALKEALDAGRVGTLRLAHLSSVVGPPAEAGGSGSLVGASLNSDWVNSAAEVVDLLRWFFGVPVERVFARACSLGLIGEPPNYVSVVLSLADGSQGVCDIGTTLALPPLAGLVRVALYGERGSMRHDARDDDFQLTAAGQRSLADDCLDGIARSLHEWSVGVGDSSLGAPLDASDARAALATWLALAASFDSDRPIVVGS